MPIVRQFSSNNKAVKGVYFLHTPLKSNDPLRISYFSLQCDNLSKPTSVILETSIQVPGPSISPVIGDGSFSRSSTPVTTFCNPCHGCLFAPPLSLEWTLMTVGHTFHHTLASTMTSTEFCCSNVIVSSARYFILGRLLFSP